MRLYAKLYSKNRIYASATAQNDDADTAKALLLCLEKIYSELDLAEPLWLSKHTRDFTRYRRVKLLPADFLEPVAFDKCEIEILNE